MPVVFVLASDWTLRVTVRAELREGGIEAIGMDSAEDVYGALASGRKPDALVLEATREFLTAQAVKDVIQRVPAIVIASRTETTPLPSNVCVLYRPVLVSEIVNEVRQVLESGPPR